METILLQLERLRRHYETSVRTHEHISLLDLSHSLRIWAELKNDLPVSFARTLAFKTATPGKKLLAAARGHRYVFCYMPGGVITYASNGQLSAGVGFGGPNEPFSSGGAFRVNSDGSTELNKFCVVAKALDASLVKLFEIENQTRCNYQRWMGAEVMRLCYLNDAGALEAKTISREIVLKRVANTLDGSHASAAKSSKGSENAFDAPVRHLLLHSMGGLPLPYFILLKIAQDILAVAPKLLGIRPL